MSKDFSASGSGKTATTTKGDNSPFTQITNQEEAEAKRLEKALATFEKEITKLNQTLEDKEQAAAVKMKETAKEELKSYKDKELSGLVKTAQSDAKKTDQALDEAYKKNKQAALDGLVNNFFDTKSPIFD